MSIKIYTASYRYAGPDRLDITVKGQDSMGKIFAPTWSMVQGYIKNPNKPKAEEDYTLVYHSLMLKSYQENRYLWDKVLQMDSVTLVCFCRPGSFCHRILLAGYLEKLGGTYIEERRKIV